MKMKHLKKLLSLSLRAQKGRSNLVQLIEFTRLLRRITPRNDRNKNFFRCFKTILFTFSVVLILSVVSCTPNNPGYLTLVNSRVDKANISVDGRGFSLKPATYISKEMSAGTHELQFSGENIKVTIQREKTTVFDTTGLACFVSADFSSGGSTVKILEKFQHERTFTPKNEITTIMGLRFPENASPSKHFTRIHQIDCDIMDNDELIVRELPDKF